MDTLYPYDEDEHTCPKCAGTLALVIIEGDETERCTECGWLVV